MGKTIKVSVILTSFNHAKYLRESIDSVLHQTYTDFELIIWDDGSTDESWQIITSYSDPRIKAFKNETLVRGTPIRNAVSKIETGEYIAIQHSDDIWESQKLEKQVAFLDENPSIGAIFTWAQVIDENGTNLPEDWFIQDNKSQWQWLRQIFHGENHLNHPSVLIRKICYQEVGLYRFGFPQTGDAEMWVRLLLKYPIHVIQERLTKHRLMSDKSNSSSVRSDTRIRMQFEFYKLLQNYRQITSFDDLVKIFPSAEKYDRKEETDIDLALALAVLEEGTFPYTQLFGLDILFEIISDPKRAANIKRLYDFEYQTFITLTGKYDVFSQEKLAELQEAVVERDGKLISLVNQLQAHERELMEIKNSSAWKIALLLRRTGLLLAPPNSRREWVVQRLINVIQFRKTRKNKLAEEDLKLIKSSDLFDEVWYLQNNPDVASAKADPARHYLLLGGFEERDPGPNFSVQSYLDSYPDIAKSGINPLIHYLKFGMAEGRIVSRSTAVQRLDAPYFGTGEINDQVVMIPPIRKIAQFSYQSTKVSIVIPTKNAGPLFRKTLEAIKKQQYEGPIELIIIDSGSTDNTLSLASEYGAFVITIPPNEFDHGLTRNRAIEKATGEIIILMSQDVLPGNEHLIHNFVTAFEDKDVAGAYARQVPRENADVITKRNLNNWLIGRKRDEIRLIRDWTLYQSLSPMEHYYFCNFDNVCSAIRRNVWQSIPFNANKFGEDIDWSQRVLESGWKIAYWPSSYVIHSHERSYRHEYDRARLCHEKLYAQFGIHTAPTWRDVFRLTFISTMQDWNYAAQHEKQFFKFLGLLVRIPFLNFASMYGQYKGANTRSERSAQINKAFDDKKMRIILTVHQFLPEFSSGTEILTLETAKELKKLGHDVSIITGFPAQKETRKERFDQYIYEGINVTRFYHNYLPNGEQSNPMEMEYDNRLFGSYFKKHLKREKPDVVHFFHLMRLSASAVDVCYDLGIPTVLTPTDFWFICPTCQLRLPNNQNCPGPDKSGVNCLRHIVHNNQPQKIKAWVQKIPNWMLAFLIYFIKKGVFFDKTYSSLIWAFSKRREFLLERINRINKVIIPTQVMMSMLTQNGLQKQRTITVPFGLNLSYIQHAKIPESSHVLRLGYIGTLSEHKGVHILVQAVKQLKERDVELKIYGKFEDFPDYVEYLKGLIQDDPRIRFCGTFPNHEIGKVFSDLDALVVPSLWHENSPLVVYSAQFAKCPVIASNMEGMSEIVEHNKNGLLFEAGNVAELTKTIETILDNMDLLQIMSNNAKNPLSIQEYTSKLIQIYTDIIQEERVI
ncbi:MAG: glycosyltransferase [Chloroflexi bacterium]|nr:glycosyltransferase [Chloroflexota bacterium]